MTGTRCHRRNCRTPTFKGGAQPHPFKNNYQEKTLGALSEAVVGSPRRVPRSGQLVAPLPTLNGAGQAFPVDEVLPCIIGRHPHIGDEASVVARGLL